VDCYYNGGLRVSNLEELNEIARRIYIKAEFAEISETSFRAAVESVMEGANDAKEHGKLYVALDDRHLLNYCGHYMIYGSEHVGAIAASLTRKYRRDYGSALKRIGIPTLLRIQNS
jgi:hypothetical protein